MMRLIAGLFLLLLGIDSVFAQAVPPPGCTTITCTGAALPTGYLSVVGNQLQNSPGSNVRPACTVFRGLPTDTQVPIRNAGFNCITIGWRDAYVGAAIATTWSPTDLSGVTLSGGNQTATTSSAISGVRSTSTHGTGKYCGEITGNSTTAIGWGIANAAMVLGNNPGSPNWIAIFPYAAGFPQNVFLGGVLLSAGATPSPTGEKVTLCLDADAKLAWFTDATMRAAGNPWNNSPTANPATATGGHSFSSMAGPFYLSTGHSNATGTSSAVLNTAGPFAVGLPSGFNVWDTAPAAPAGCNSLSQIDGCVASAQAAGLKVILNHLGNEIPSAGSACVGRQQNGLWFDSGGSSGNDNGCGDGHNWTYAGFKANTVALLQRYAGNPTVIGYEFHNEPVVNGVFTAGQSGGGPGTFNINTAGQVIGPNGAVYRAIGPNIEDTTLGISLVADVQRLAPKTNTVRLAVGAVCQQAPAGYLCGFPIATLEAWIRTYIAQNIVVMIESHSCNGGNINASAIDMVGEYNWYNTIANDFKADPKAPYVWFESANECSHGGITRENRNVYNAVRNCPQAALTCDWLSSTGYSAGAVVYNKGNTYTAASNCTSGATAPLGSANTSDGGCSWNFRATGNPTLVGFEVSIYGDGNPDGPSSQYNSMSNIMWTPHAYNSNTGGQTNQTTVNNSVASWVVTNGNYTTQYGGGKIPSLFSEVGFIDYANVCGGPGNPTPNFNNPSACGSAQIVTAVMTPTTTLHIGGLIWNWHFDNCCETQTDLTNRNSNPLQLFSPFGPIFANNVAANSPGPVAPSGGGGTNPPVNWNGGGDTDVRLACSDVGAAVFAVNPGVVQFCPGPLNNTTTLLSGGSSVSAAPAPAAAAGFNTRTFGPDLHLGQNWLAVSGATVTQETPTSLRMGGSGTSGVTWNEHAHTLGTFGIGGGAYIEATLYWDNNYAGFGVSGSDGWPAWWAWTVEDTSWAGHPGYADTIEIDFFEAWSNVSWSWAFHEWMTAVAPFESSLSTSPPDFPNSTSHTQPHKFGWLKEPATSTTKGHGAAYLDRVKVPGSDIYWNQYNSALPPPVSATDYRTPAGAGSALSSLDHYHLYLILGTGTGNPMHVTAVEVWQANGASNLPATP